MSVGPNATSASGADVRSRALGRTWKALVLGLLGGAMLVLVQQRAHRRCPHCQRRWVRITQHLARWRAARAELVS